VGHEVPGIAPAGGMLDERDFRSLPSRLSGRVGSSAARD
jgi:hypothetical protein